MYLTPMKKITALASLACLTAAPVAIALLQK
jgi:hypothetical protein